MISCVILGMSSIILSLLFVYLASGPDINNDGDFVYYSYWIVRLSVVYLIGCFLVGKLKLISSRNINRAIAILLYLLVSSLFSVLLDVIFGLEQEVENGLGDIHDRIAFVLNEALYGMDNHLAFLVLVFITIYAQNLQGAERSRSNLRTFQLTKDVDWSTVTYIRANEHYIRINYAGRVKTILQRFSDAVEDIRFMFPDLGIQVHRSWWVAFRAIDVARRTKGNGFELEMLDGTTVRVTSTYCSKFEEAAKRIIPDRITL